MGARNKTYDVDLVLAEQTIERLKEDMADKEYANLKTIVDGIKGMYQMLQKERASIRHLKGLFKLHNSSEKMENIMPEQWQGDGANDDPAPANQPADVDEPLSPTQQTAQCCSNMPGSACKEACENEPKEPRKGHGRRPASAYENAEMTYLPAPCLPGSPCPKCDNGTLREIEPSVIIRIVGSPPLRAKGLEVQTLRCSCCGKVIKSKIPADYNGPKYDPSAVSALALQHFSGMPYHRLENLQELAKTPVPASTQYHILEQGSHDIAPVCECLKRAGARSDVAYADDTSVSVLEYSGKRRDKTLASEARLPQEAALPQGYDTSSDDNHDAANDEACEASPSNATTSSESTSRKGKKKKARKAKSKKVELVDADGVATSRTGQHTTGIVAETEGHQIALFFIGRRHAGENLGELLLLREPELPPLILMTDALRHNNPKGYHDLIFRAYCMAHARRPFVDLLKEEPDICTHFIKQIALVYKIDADCKARNLDPLQRLAEHQEHSKPILDALYLWAKEKITPAAGNESTTGNESTAEKKTNVEENSDIGKALAYVVNHWNELTLFLRVAGAPIDNNKAERAIKRFIALRKASLFFRTKKGARVASMYLSLIYTAELNNQNPFEYLTALLRHAGDVAKDPERWLPWNYKETLQKIQASLAS